MSSVCCWIVLILLWGLLFPDIAEWWLFHYHFHHQYDSFHVWCQSTLFFPTFPFLSSFFTSLTLNSNHLVAWSQPTDNCQQLWNQGECACQRWNLLRTLCTPSIIYANLPLSQIPPTQKIFRGLGPSVHFLR